jgi:hypothetical protein
MMEQRMYSTVGEYKIEGTADFIGDYKGVPSLVDFKTSNMDYKAEKIISDEQLYMYSYLAKKELDYMPQQVVYFVLVKSYNPKYGPKIQVKTHPLSEYKLEDMMHNVELMCRDLDQRIEWPRNPKGCGAYGRRCGFFDKCYGDKDAK